MLTNRLWEHLTFTYLLIFLKDFIFSEQRKCMQYFTISSYGFHGSNYSLKTIHTLLCD